MALDTANRRASALSVGRPWILAAPFPDGAIGGQPDRQQQAWSYPGIAASAAVVGDGVFVPLLRVRRR